MEKKAAAKSRHNRSRSRGSDISIGSSLINRGDWGELQRAWKERDLTLFLGAGISIPYGVPPWRDLVLEMLFEQAGRASRFRLLWPHYLRAMTSWMADYFDYNPLMMARLVEKEIAKRAAPGQAGVEFVRRLRQHLYGRTKPTNGDTAIKALARLIQHAQPNRNIAAIFSFNFDCLLEEALRERGIEAVSMVKGSRIRAGVTTVIHPHGYIPRVPEDDQRQGLVFTEDDYHQLTDTVFHWALTEIVAHLRQHRALFIGLSMSDPNLRRLLDASRFNRDRPWHWQVQKRHTVGAGTPIAEVKADIEKRAKRYATDLGVAPAQRKETQDLDPIIRDTLRQADTYDRRVFEAMGVKTIWIEDWADLPLLIDAIAD